MYVDVNTIITAGSLLGPVTEAIDKSQKHINKQAHDQED